MSFRPTLARLAKEVSHRSPAIRFPDRSSSNHDSSSHQATPHPCAPQSVIDSFPRFQHARSDPSQQSSPSAQNSSSYGGPVDAGKGGERQSGSSSSEGGGKSSGGGGSSGTATMEEYQVPAWLKRNRHAPTEAEIDAIQSGGATESTAVTRETKLTWYTEQI